MILTSIVKTMIKVTTVMAVRAKTILLMIMAVAPTKMEPMIMLTLRQNGGMMMGLMMIKCQCRDNNSDDDGRNNDGDTCIDEREGDNSLMVITVIV